MEKKCTKCGEVKEINEFVKDKNKKDGYRNVCKKCENLKRRKTPIKPIPKDGFKYCAKCNKELSLEEFNMRMINGNKKYHSYCKECERKYDKNRYTHTCEICGKHYKSGRKNSKICNECHSKIFAKIGADNLKTLVFSGEKNPMYGVRRYGKDNPNYNPNKTDKERETQRYKLHGDDVKKWRVLVYKKDNYTCQCCGYNKGKILNAHHLDGYSWCKDKRFDVNNGVTLCKKCHMKFHHIYGVKNNTREQFNKFIKECCIP